MTRTTSLLFFSLLCGCAAFEPPVPGSGKMVTETREASGFKAIDIMIPTKLVVKKGETASLELVMDDNLQSLVTTEVLDGRLIIKSKKNIAPSKNATLTIVAPQIERVSVAGAVSGTIEELSGENVQLEIAGVADLQVGLATTKFSGEIAGSGKVTVTGTCSTMRLDTAGSGDWDTTSVLADEVKISIAGSGSARVHANKTLTVSIAGSGDVDYSGDAKVEKSIAGSGSVESTSMPPQSRPGAPPASVPAAPDAPPAEAEKA